MTIKKTKMKNITYLIIVVFLFLNYGCKDNTKTQKNEKSIEVKIEKSDNRSKAEITIRNLVKGKIKEEVQIIEGSHEEVMKKVEQITADSNINNKDNLKKIKKLKFNLNPKSDTNTGGEITFTEESGLVTLEASIKGLSVGTHAIHIHEKADCSSADGKSSGGHWNPTFQPHGEWGSDKGYHRGDIGNFNADKNGNGIVSFSTGLWCLGCNDETKNILGKAIIVHQGEDDLVSQPSGAAGSRISCAGIIQ